MAESTQLFITADRDSVCAGDDCTSHEATFSVPNSCNIFELLNSAWCASPLAGIAGGQATWLIEVGGYGESCVGVMAQQWKQPKLTIPVETTADVLFAGKAPCLYFRYVGQSNPDAVFEGVCLGKHLP